MKQGKFARIVVVVVMAGLLAGMSSVARADDVARAKSEAGVGLATAVANLFYIPAKIGYALLGGITGGLGYVLTGGNQDVAQRVWVSSFGGDYIISQQQLKGNEPLRFSGSADPDM